MKLTSKVAIVTGASSGIGEATAKQLAAEGAKVALVARRADRLEQLAGTIRESGGTAITIIADMTDEAPAREVVRQTQEAWGQIDILVNNAGVMLLGPILNADTEDWRRMINLNVLGLMYCTHAVLPRMKERGSGHIVNISSVAGRTARSGAAVYNASKWAVGAFSEALRQEVLEMGIRVTIVEPGFVATELLEHITHQPTRQSMQERIQSITPLQPEDIATAVVYAVTQPAHVNVNEILVRPLEQML